MGDVECIQHLVLHQYVLDDLAFELGDIDASKLQDT